MHHFLIFHLSLSLLLDTITVLTTLRLVGQRRRDIQYETYLCGRGGGNGASRQSCKKIGGLKPIRADLGITLLIPIYFDSRRRQVQA
jgi:hypothetical protein